jgi:hypothetical protein
MTALRLSRRVPNALLGGGAGLVALLVAVTALWVRSTTAYTTPAECVTRSTIEEVNACLEPYYRAMAQHGAGLQVLHDLQQLSATGAFDDCHMLAHHYGHIAYQLRGEFVTTFQDGTEACNGGYYHGVVEAAFYAVATGRDELPTHHQIGYAPATLPLDCPPSFRATGLCEALKQGPERLYSECVHGIGHGLMYYYEHDVMRSLPGCAQFSEPRLAQYCRDGVFMENVLQFVPLAETDFVERARTACDGLTLEGDDFRNCYVNIGEIATIYLRHNRPKAMSFCFFLDASQEARSWCATGVSQEMRRPH